MYAYHVFCSISDTDGKSTLKENASFSSVLEQSHDAASSLGDINSSWFDDERWNLTVLQETNGNGVKESDGETVQDVSKKHQTNIS